MALTPATLPRHELTGLPARVRAAADEGRVGTTGRITAETTATLTIATSERALQVPKRGTTFAIGVPRDGDHRRAAIDAADAEWVAVSGDRLIARPARRTEHRGDSTWR
ncbi:ribonuclease P protein component 1 [Halococcoides cellulosivorans]|uniref:Ribonuclease P protein component 1 n=1 Tax=Halococcoides cellulosivorans TaxID=1679096 RepID=A0A2R4X278_9EURY|nr:ribonuclease P protein subunit [Halococcoides cellulosivorans]AWB27910.1 ribonuclease P [Halococcoides cellulosivorans]